MMAAHGREAHGREAYGREKDQRWTLARVATMPDSK